MCRTKMQYLSDCEEELAGVFVQFPNPKAQIQAFAESLGRRLDEMVPIEQDEYDRLWNSSPLNPNNHGGNWAA
jgi:hypothetical protein